MARYSTPPGVCGQGNHEITDAPGVSNQGYTSPIVQRYSVEQPRVRLCREHYLLAYAARFPNAPLPEI